jgi:hypothetical protein
MAGFLILMFAILRIVARATWLVLALVVMTHNVSESLTDFVFLLLRPPVLSALSSLLHPRHHFLSDIIVWATFAILRIVAQAT